jgi:hypothetical protein
MLGKPYKVRIETNTYRDGGIAVFAIEQETEEHFCSLSVNLPETKWLKEGEWYGKHWSENDGFLPQLVAQGVIEEVPCVPAESGFVQNIRAYRLK